MTTPYGQITVGAPTEAHQLEDSDKGEVEKQQGRGPVPA
jgi:hypothetical protein